MKIKKFNEEFGSNDPDINEKTSQIIETIKKVAGEYNYLDQFQIIQKLREYGDKIWRKIPDAGPLRNG